MPASLHQCLAGLGLAAGISAAEPKTIPPRVIEEPVWTLPVMAEPNGEARALLSIGASGELVDF